MSVRLFHRGARLVFVVQRRAAGDEVWWAPHRAPPDWKRILEHQLRLIGLPPGPPAAGPRILTPLGEIDWKPGRRWSIMTLRLRAGSETKRRLVAAALLKAARYARPGA